MAGAGELPACPGDAIAPACSPCWPDAGEATPPVRGAGLYLPAGLLFCAGLCPTPSGMLAGD
jgi:hypothetical protein